jgi:riboflavin synthase
VDGLATIESRHGDGRSERFRIQAPDELAKYIAEKGSITLDGVSLTVNKVDGATFELNIVPHTLLETIIGNYQTGTKVNLEVDVVARYLERLLLGNMAAKSSDNKDNISQEFLAQHGFYKI